LTAVSNHSVISNAHVNHGRTDEPVPAIEIHNPKPSTTTPRRCVQRTYSCFLLFFPPRATNVSRGPKTYLL